MRLCYKFNLRVSVTSLVFCICVTILFFCICVTRFFTCVWSFHYFLIFSSSLCGVRRAFAKTVESLQVALNVSKVTSPWNQLDSSPLVLRCFSILSNSLRPWNNCRTMLGRRTALNARSLMLFLNSVVPYQTPTHWLKWCCNSLGIRRKEM